MVCKKCHSTIPEGARFCPKCGTKVEILVGTERQVKRCPSCGAENPVEAKFCKVDGFNFQKTEEGREERPIMEKKPLEGLICPKCGTSYPPGARYCRKDGALLREGVEPVHIPPKVIPSPEEGRWGVRKRASRVWVPLVLLILMIVGVGSYLYFYGGLRGRVEQMVAHLIGRIAPTKPEKEISKPVGGESVPDISVLEGRINDTLRDKGLSDVNAEVGGDLVVVLRGVVSDPRDKRFASEVVESFRGIKGVRNEILVKKTQPEEKIIVKAPQDITKPREASPPKKFTPVEKPAEVPLKTPAPPRAPPPPEKPKESLPPTPLPSIDIAKLQEEINLAFKRQGLNNVYAEIDRELIATLNGFVDHKEEEQKAINITKSRREIKEIINNIQIKTPEVVKKEDQIDRTLDPIKLEFEINMALKNAGFTKVVARVNPNFEVSLKGVVQRRSDRDEAYRIAKSFKEVRTIKNYIFAVIPWE